MKKILAVLLAMAMIFGLAACSGGSEPAAESTSVIDEIKANGKLTVGTSADYPPYEFHTEI
ncbi:MAG: hypothetical protein II418_04960, partial [Firmicutes bacterium]|nr:hypothetical protein [Bacillota bacterium]